MVQTWPGLITPLDTDGDILATEITNMQLAVASGHEGSSRPSYITSGGLWTKDVSANIKQVFLYDGLGDRLIAEFDTATNITTLAGGVTISSAGLLTVPDNIVVGGSVDGRNIAADGLVLDNIQPGATVDQTGAEIKTAYEAQTKAFTDAQFDKLTAIASGATKENQWISTYINTASSTNVIVPKDTTLPQRSEMALIAVTATVTVPAGAQVEVHFNANLYHDDRTALLGLFRTNSNSCLRLIALNGFTSAESAFSASDSFIDTPGAGNFIYELRYGCETGGTAYLNSSLGSALYGGAWYSGLRVKVIQA